MAEAPPRARPRRKSRPPGVMVIVAYRPKPGKARGLLALTRKHLVILRRLGLVTDRPESVMRAAGGTVVEVFEWVSRRAVARAHHHSEVAALWAEYAKVSDYVPLRKVKEASNLFAEFRPLDPT